MADRQSMGGSGYMFPEEIEEVNMAAESIDREGPRDDRDISVDQFMDNTADGMTPEEVGLKRAMDQRDKLQMRANLLSGFQDLLKGATGASGGKEVSKRMMDKGDQIVDDYKADQKSKAATKRQEIADKISRIKLGKAEFEFANQQKINDPNSSESKFAQDEYIAYRKSQGQPLTPDQEANIRRQSAKSLHANSKHLQDKLSMMMSQRRMELQEEEMQRKKEGHEDRMSLKREQKLDRDVETISKRLEKSGIMGQKNSFDIIEDYLKGMNVDLANEKTFKNVEDIPGMGVGGSFRPDFATPNDAVQFRQNVQSLANQLLKQRSGAAVTDQEYRRFLKEVGSGDFSSEENLMTGLAKMKKDLISLEDNIMKSADPKALKEYKRRMGIMEEAPESDMVKMKIPNGKIKLIPRDKVDAAKKAGAEEI